MKSKLSPSAPLNLCPPTGVTNRTVKCVSYFYPTSVNAKRFNLPDGGYDVNLTTFSGEKSKPKTVAGFATKAEAIAHANTLAHPWASWMVGIDSPASPVKDTPADPLEGLNEDEIVLRHAQSWSKAGIPDLGAHLDAPASPVASVGVPHTPLPWVAKPEHDKRHRVIPIMAATGYNRSTLEDGDDQSVLVASCADHHVTRATAEANAAFIVLACNSNAAKDAKIKELSLRMELLIMRMESEMSRFPKEEKRNRKGFMDRGRAALALPCAPQES